MNQPADLRRAVRGLRALILAGEHYRQAVAQITGLGATETQAISYLAIQDERGQTELGTHLGITSSASTALVDRLERQGIAERFAHPSDRRRVLVRLSPRGARIVEQSHEWLAAALCQAQIDDVAQLATSLDEIAHSLRAQSGRILAQHAASSAQSAAE